MNCIKEDDLVLGWIGRKSMGDWQKNLSNIERGIILVLAFVFVSFVLSQNLCPQAISEEIPSQTELEKILKKTSEYCQRLLNSALHFVCIEEIKERIDYSRDNLPQNYERKKFQPLAGAVQAKQQWITSIKNNTLIYDYQLIRKGGQIGERRILLEENGKKMHEENASLKTELFEHKYVIAGPIGLLSDFWQERHDFRIIKEEKYKGVDTVILEAVPKMPDEVQHLAGRIWISKDDFSILKIEWDQKNIKNFKKIEALAKNLNSRPRIIQVSEYGLEKKGIKFPSRYTVRETYVDRRGQSFLRSETVVIYRDYKFFTVETDVKY